MTVILSRSSLPLRFTNTFRQCRWLFTASTLVVLSACGGGGGGGGGSKIFIPDTGSSSTWQQGVFKPSTDFANKCAVPRTGRSDVTGESFKDTQGSLLDEKNWLRSWSNENYLWYNEITDVNPNNGDTPTEYFDKLKTFNKTSSGALKDKYHYTEATAQVEARYSLGAVYGYGLGLYNGSLVPPRDVNVAYVEAGSPAELAGMKRGEKIVKVDNIDIVNDNTASGVDAINEGLFPSQINQVHTIETLPNGASQTKKYVLQSASVVEKPVYFSKVIATDTGNIGYVVFNSHVDTAEAQMADVISSFKAQNVSDVVLDLRYNGGGYIYIASDVGYMLAGAKSEGKIFDQLTFNDKIGKDKPINFLSVGSSGATQNTKLPTLDLTKVYIISGPHTCSASESIINGLRGVDVEVILVGTQTCGKPYGFQSRDNCGTTYSSINFSSSNAKGYGDYSEGFFPASVDNGLDQIAGCSVGEDLTHDLGDINEKKLAAVLSYRSTKTCGASASSFALKAPPASAGGVPLILRGIKDQYIK